MSIVSAGSRPQFQQSVVLVTGAAQGIGLAIARRFVLAGAFVALNDLDEEKLERALDGLPGDAVRHMGYAADVTVEEKVDAMVASVVEKWGPIDIVVNNAGIYPSSQVVEMSVTEWDRVMAVNARGVFLVSRAVARQMIGAGLRGQIVNISSGSYHRGRVGSAHYCASKAAVTMFTKVLAMELAQHGIRVNAVAPGLIDNDTLELNPEYLAATREQIPAGRLGHPEDVAATVIGLAAIESDYITGAVLAVDGGLALGRYGIPVA